jgi:hypothetical protein
MENWDRFEMGKITSVEISDEASAYIKKAIKEERFRHFREFMTRCLELAVIYTIDHWDVHKGIFFVDPCRICLMPTETLEVILKYIPNEEHEQVGRDIGNCARAYFRRVGLDPKNSENWGTTLRRMTYDGWGRFSINGNIIENAHPVLPDAIVKGLLESVLNVALEPVELTKEAYIFRVTTPTP